MSFRLLLIFLLFPSVLHAADCLAPEQLKALDRQYEQALRKGDPEFMADLLAENFVWVHNHAGSRETKSVLMARLGDGHDAPLSRESEAVEVRRLDKTAVISGFTTVTKADAEGENRQANRYHFMRTYVAQGGNCRLLANQTMKVWSSSGEPL